MGLSIIGNIFKSVHVVHFFVTPLPKEYYENVYFKQPGLKPQSIPNEFFFLIIRQLLTNPPAYAMYAHENADNSGRHINNAEYYINKHSNSEKDINNLKKYISYNNVEKKFAGLYRDTV